MDKSSFVALVAALAAALTSTVIFHPELRQVVSPSIAPVAVVWAMISVSSELAMTANFARKCIVSGWLAAVPSCLLVMLGSNFRFAVTVLSFPLPFLYAACDPVCSNPWQQLLFPPCAIVIHYGVLVFGPPSLPECWRLASDFSISFTVGSVAGLLVHLVVSAVLRRRASFCVAGVDVALQACLEQLLYVAEGNLAYFQTGGKVHREAIQERLLGLKQRLVVYDTAVGAWKFEWWSDKPSPEALNDLQSRLAAVYAIQTGLLETFEEGYSEIYKALLWDTIALEVEDLRLNGIIALRNVCHWNGGSEDTDEARVRRHCEELLAAAGRFEQALVNSRLAHCSKDEVNANGMKRVTLDDSLRAMQAVQTLKRFARSVGELFDALRAAGIQDLARRPPTGWLLLQRSWGCITAFVADVQNPAKYFVASPAETILERGGQPASLRVRARRFLRYPFRLTLLAHIVSLAFVSMNRELPEVRRYAIWALVPVILCFMPTTGAVVLKSARRLGGTLVGAAVALLCVYLSPRNAPAALLETLIVTFTARYASEFPSIGYGGITFGLTWDVVMLGTFDTNVSESFDGFAVALWRVGMTVVGVLLCVALSISIFPAHATKSFEQMCAEALVCTTEISVVTSRDLLARSSRCYDRRCIKRDSQFSTLINLEDPAEAEELPLAELEFSVRFGNAARLAMLNEANAERWLVPRVFPNLEALQRSAERLADIASVLWLNSAVFEGGREKFCDEFFLNAQTWGPELRRSICRMQETLRQASLGLAIRLRGVRVPGIIVSRHKVEHALHMLEHDAVMARQEVWASGQMPKMLEGSLDALYAALYGLIKYSHEWLLLDEAVSGSKLNSSGASAGSSDPGSPRASPLGHSWAPDLEAPSPDDEGDDDGDAAAAPTGVAKTRRGGAKAQQASARNGLCRFWRLCLA